MSTYPKSVSRNENRLLNILNSSIVLQAQLMNILFKCAKKDIPKQGILINHCENLFLKEILYEEDIFFLKNSSENIWQQLT